ncbi:MAG: hypothetical protein JST54_26715 [Deltaproteobacteria bacterium]|nr:hypothetical protein [Deltaproteobacteria bacterium]
MRALLVVAVLSIGGLARAEDFPSDAPKVHEKCKKPVCACQDTTHPEGCLDKDACAKACEDHGGAVAMHKKHRRGHKGGQAPDAPTANE